MLIPMVFGAIESWFNYGNDPALNMQYQSGTQSLTLAQDYSITYNTDEQPYIFDFDNDGDKEYVVFYTGFIRIYTLENFSLEQEVSTGFNKPVDQEVADLDDDGYKEFVTLAAPVANASQLYFNSYEYVGSSLSTYKSFQLDLDYIRSSGLKCGTDFDGDLDDDCMLIARQSSNTSNYILLGYDENSVSASTPSVNISFGNNIATSVPEFIDYDGDSNLEALSYYADGSSTCYVTVINQTGLHKVITTSSSPYQDCVARWYNRDGGFYEILVLDRLTDYVPGDGTERSGFQLELFTVAGASLWSTTYGTSCPDTVRSGLGAGGCALFVSYHYTMSIGFSNINDGRIYVYGSCKESASEGTRDTEICTYDKDGNIFSREPVTGGSATYAYTKNKVVWADMTDGTNLEAVFAKGVVGLDGVIKYSPMGTADNDGWCLPVDVDNDLNLDLICSQEGVNTSILTTSAPGAGGENLRPYIIKFILSEYFPNAGQWVNVDVRARDPEANDIWYAVECDYESGNEIGYTMADYPEVDMIHIFDDQDYTNCLYETNGTYVIKAWVNDEENGGDDDLLSNMNSYNYTITVGGIDIDCEEPFIFCDDFSYAAPITYNDWYVRNLDDVFDQSLAPTAEELLINNESWKVYKYIDWHTNPIISFMFNLSHTYQGIDDEFITFSTYTSVNYLEQVLLEWRNNTINVWSGQNITVIGSYANNTYSNYKIYIYYEDVPGLDKRANTYDVIQDGSLLAGNLEFWHGSEGQYDDVNISADDVYDEDYENYMDLFDIVFGDEGGIYSLSYPIIAKVDDFYVYAGTSLEYDNTADMMIEQLVPPDEYEDIVEYFGCWISNGPNSGEYDCEYLDYKCYKCCAYVGGVLKAVRPVCTVGRVFAMYASKFRTWFFRDIWYFAIFGTLGVLIILLYAKLKK
jgi:hypothetical protein